MVILPPTEEPAEYNSNYVLYWNHVALELNRLVITLGGPQNGPPSAARALGIFHLAINDAYFALNTSPFNEATTYLSTNATEPSRSLPPVGSADNARLAVAGAAITVLRSLYTRPSAKVATATTNQLSQFVDEAANRFSDLDTLSSSYRFGVDVGKVMVDLLAIKADEPGFDQDAYRPKEGKFGFDDDPTNPISIVPVDINDPDGPKKAIKVYNAPFYGMTAKRLAVQGVVNGIPVEHIVADPPVGFSINDTAEYEAAFEEVIRLGGKTGLNTTKRTPEQQVSAYFWAYDGANLIGTPLRLYNQILRKVAWERKPDRATSEITNADFVRLFAFVNAAMADAGIFAWQEKYCFEFWRPLSGVREDRHQRLVDPFWLELGAPATNTDNISFKPPFPTYVSGHATFASAGFQAARLYYRRRDNLSFAPDEADDITFEFVSDELNGINRDLREPYNPNLPITDQVGTVRTRVARRFPSLWAAMFDNAISRIYLGVHWRFDAFASADVLKSEGPIDSGVSVYKEPANIKYVTLGPRGDRPGQFFPIGGVPLGIGIANDIFQSNLRPTPEVLQPSGREKCGDGVRGTLLANSESKEPLTSQNGTLNHHLKAGLREMH